MRLRGGIAAGKLALQQGQTELGKQLHDQLQELNRTAQQEVGGYWAYRCAELIDLADESNRIGTVHIPATLWKALGKGTVHEVTLPIKERASYLLEDYEHFPADPHRISSLVDELRRIRGNAIVDEWQLQIESGQWLDFVLSILEHHYDLAYRRPGSEGGNYQAPSNTVALPDAAPATLKAAAATLLP